MPRRISVVCLLGCLGCVGPGDSGRELVLSPVAEPTLPVAAEKALPLQPSIGPQPAVPRVSYQTAGNPRPRFPNAGIQAASYRANFREESLGVPIDTVDGAAIEPKLIEALASLSPAASELSEPIPASGPVVNLNLPTVIAMVGGQHPAVGLARWRVQEAYARLSQSRVLWLPSLRAGFGFHRHDGNYQASSGEVVDINRNSFQYGLGVGGVGAGTTMRPGVLAEFHLADAIFQPKIAKSTAVARSFESTAVVNEQMRAAAVAYLELLGAHQDVRLIEETRGRTAQLFKLTSDFAASGEGLRADADRMGTELSMVDNRLLAARERIDAAAARLAQVLSSDSTGEIVPMDVAVLPIELVQLQTDRSSLIQTGLSNRPELRQSQALVAAACEQYRRQKLAPMVPSVLLGLSTGGFGGGLGNNLDNVDSRYDVDALVSWEVRNLGLGEHAIRREAEAGIQQAKFEKIRVMDQVAREVTEAYGQVRYRSQQIGVTQTAIQTAKDSYERNISRIRDGQGLPLEALQSLQALEDVQRAYLNAIIDHNQAQFQLQWALGWPVTAPSSDGNRI